MRDFEAPQALGINATVKAYILERDETFRELDKIREAGWANPKGDEHFRQNRNQADNATQRTKYKFYGMMIKIGNELNTATSALTISPDIKTPVILDLCMAPGGFSAAATRANPRALLRGITLPPQLGGHDMLLRVNKPTISVMSLDITLLAGEMGLDKDDIPANHPDAAKFIYTRPFQDIKADLIFCDGQVLRTHAEHRGEHREKAEATRLDTAQLVLALNRIRAGGTLVMLLHKVEAWTTVRLLYRFSQFSDVQVYKPHTNHQTRSSFYLIAKNVRPESEEARRAVEGWKRGWRRATFWGDRLAEDGEGEDDSVVAAAGERVEDVLAEFGERLIELGRPVWQIQAEALRNAKWNRK